ncbi:MAG: folylpolyglutamate synthase/dihydrofolate synthase family protein [Candidatus Micrarchaeota archaeon]
MDYRNAISYLENLPSPEVWNLSTAKDLASRMGIKFNCKIIHVAGTNGKGSVCAYLSSILKRAGFKAGTYTSPHLDRYNERIVVDGREITDREFAGMVGNGKKSIEKMRLEGICPSEFEALTCMAFKYFEGKQLDFLVLETGLGGRLDATNIAPSNTQIITKISFDHMKNLGDSLEKIASEKAGIIKQNSTVITTSKEPLALKAIRRVCRKKNAKLLVLGKDFDYNSQKASVNGGEFDYTGKVDRKNLRISLPGEHQFENASGAIAAIDSIAWKNQKFSENSIKKGLLDAKWAGRLELFPRLGILVDGAHNEDGMLSLRNSLDKIFLEKYGGLILALGIMADKEYSKMIKIISPKAKRIILTRAKTERSALPEKLQEECKRIGVLEKTRIAQTVKGAIGLAMKIRKPQDIICITGSLYVAGEARKILLEMEKM